MSNAAINNHYDYIISGAGAAGLSLIARMINSGKFTHKKILLVDKGPKTSNDRTWCFWEKGQGFFESIVFHSWHSIWFHSKHLSKLLDISPYQYKMIRGIDFYNFCFELIASQKNITVVYGAVSEIKSNEKETYIILDGEKVTSAYIFNSILFDKPSLNSKEFYLLQHFKGWTIETKEPVFNQKQATLMDFRVSQDKGTSFVYVMPFTSTTALVEYTMFSPKLLDQSDYDIHLHSYINERLYCTEFQILSEEFGIIPMTNYRFPVSDHNIINIGTAGGQTKASTGYTFMFIQKNADAIIESLLNEKHPSQKISSGKYHFYDSVLLNVLSTHKLPGEVVFAELFKKNPPQFIFQFLDNDSTIVQDIKLISSLPTLPFLKAGLQEMF